jgi:hypothetical protein
MRETSGREVRKKGAQPYPRRSHFKAEADDDDGPRGELATDTFADLNIEESKVKTVFLNYLQLLSECISESSAALPTTGELYGMLDSLERELGDSRVQPLILRLFSSHV